MKPMTFSLKNKTVPNSLIIKVPEVQIPVTGNLIKSWGKQGLSSWVEND